MVRYFLGENPWFMERSAWITQTVVLEAYGGSETLFRATLRFRMKKSFSISLPSV